MKMAIRWITLSILIISMVLTGFGCGQKDKVVLHVFNWGEYIDEDLIDKFEAETGISVIYDTFETNESMLAKLEAGGAAYDVLFPSDYIVEELIKKDMLLELDYSNIPNFKYIDERFTNKGFDPENKYSVPYFWGTLGILYNKDMVTEPVEGWDILWDDKYKGNILMLDSLRDTIGVSLKRLGYSMNTTNADELQEAKEDLILQKELTQGYYVDEIRDMMISGDAALAVDWSGVAMDIYWEEVENIGYAVPKGGTNLWFDSMVIPKTSEHKKEAEMFINFLTDPDNAYQNTEFVGYSTPNKAVYDKMMEESPEILEMDAYWPSDEVLDRCEVFVDVGDARELYNKVWTEIQAK